MSNIIAIINKITNKETGSPASMEKIEQAEKRLGLKFAEDYKEYLTTFGALVTDYVELTNVRDGEVNVCDQTEDLRNWYRPFPKDMYVVFYAGIDDIVVLQNSTGEIFYITSEHELMPAYSSLAEFLQHIEF